MSVGVKRAPRAPQAGALDVIKTQEKPQQLLHGDWWVEDVLESRHAEQEKGGSEAGREKTKAQQA